MSRPVSQNTIADSCDVLIRDFESSYMPNQAAMSLVLTPAFLNASSFQSRVPSGSLKYRLENCLPRSA
jgi:hypothetical protein